MWKWKPNKLSATIHGHFVCSSSAGSGAQGTKNANECVPPAQINAWETNFWLIITFYGLELKTMPYPILLQPTTGRLDALIHSELAVMRPGCKNLWGATNFHSSQNKCHFWLVLNLLVESPSVGRDLHLWYTCVTVVALKCVRVRASITPRIYQTPLLW